MVIHLKWMVLVLIVLVSISIGTSGDTVTNTGGSESNRDLQPGGDGGQENTSYLQERPFTVITGPDAASCHTRLVLLGTTGGVSWYADTDRTSSSSALVVGDSVYIIDIGQGTASRLSEAFNTGSFVNTPAGRIENKSSTFLKNAEALFLTHLHQDHTADYPELLVIGPGAGLGTSVDPVSQQTVKDPFIVIGPGDRGVLEADLSGFLSRGGEIIYTDSADPALITPTPGTRQMTDLVWQAFSQGINDVTLDDAYPDFRSLVEVREIGGSGPGDISLPVTVPDPNNETCTAMDPFEVYRDGNIRVTATLVNHHQVFPSFAYRFETEDGSVVFSGDTGPDTNGNLQRLADGADILVHEVIDPAWIDLRFGTPEPGSRMDALKSHMLRSHTSIDAVGQVASECKAGTLVLNHIVPGNTPAGNMQKAEGNFSGQLIIGEDLMQIGIAKAQ